MADLIAYDVDLDVLQLMAADHRLPVPMASRRGGRVQVLTSSAATPLMSSHVWPGV